MITPQAMDGFNYRLHIPQDAHLTPGFAQMIEQSPAGTSSHDSHPKGKKYPGEYTEGGKERAHLFAKHEVFKMPDGTDLDNPVPLVGQRTYFDRWIDNEIFMYGFWRSNIGNTGAGWIGAEWIDQNSGVLSQTLFAASPPIQPGMDAQFMEEATSGRIPVLPNNTWLNMFIEWTEAPTADEEYQVIMCYTNPSTGSR